MSINLRLLSGEEIIPFPTPQTPTAPTTKLNIAQFVRKNAIKVDQAQYPVMQWIEVTVQMAQAFLAQMDRNRRLKPGLIERLRKELRTGQWRLTHQGLAFTTENLLIDGQHRLHALIAEGVSVIMPVTYNIPINAKPKIDGGSTRFTRDQLEINDGMRHADLACAWANVNYYLAHNAHSQQSREDVLTWYEKNSKSAEMGYALINTAPSGEWRKAPTMGAIVFAHPTAPRKIAEFGARLFDGAEQPVGSPLLLLRSYLITASKSAATRDERRVLARKVLTAAYAYIRGETLRKLVVDEKAVEFFVKKHI